MNQKEVRKIGSYEDDDNYGNDCFALEGILRMEMSVSHWNGPTHFC
jgi:hypothetical protein